MTTIDQDAIQATLRSTFGHAGFRPLQEEIVETILQGSDAFVLMPTGGGKSLCYQLPSLFLDGLTVVVSPLIALMKNQVDQMAVLGVPASFINSSLEIDEIRRREREVRQGKVKLLYVAPERLMTPEFLRLLSTVRLAHLVIDEAHCISEWGHDFRPEYRELKRLRQLFPTTPVSAFTATATERVRLDIRQQLGLTDAASFLGSFNRPNLFYEVRPKDGAYQHLTSYLVSDRSRSGIIYCRTRLTVDTLAERLRADGFDAIAYHAGLDPDERRKRQDAFIRDDTPIIVATIAFGMGIDKPDVRFVVHYDVPKNLEGYYQESGRAGRDGEPADCILYYSRADLNRYYFFIDQMEEGLEGQVARQQLDQMAEWAESATCRRQSLLAYFNEAFSGQPAPCCDICRTPPELVDYTIPAQMFLSCVVRTGQRFGSGHVIQVLRGSRSQKVLERGHDQLSTYGIGRDRSTDEWRFVARELIRAGYLRQDPEAFNALKVTASGREMLSQRRTVMLAPPPMIETARQADKAETTPHPELFEQLRRLRKQLADERQVPPYVIFHDSTLRRLAAALPESREALLATPGIGMRKVEEFGDTFLEVIAGYVRETGAEPADASEPVPIRSRSNGMTKTKRLILELFRDEGYSVEEIAEMRGRSPVTIEGHLADAIELGEALDLDRLVPPETQERIRTALAQLGDAYLTPIKEHLGDDVSFAEIKFVRAAVRREARNGSGPTTVAAVTSREQ